MFSNPDHDYRARQDLKGDDKFRYENGLMNNNELRNLEAGYNLDDARKRAREEEERRRSNNDTSSSSSSSSSSSTSSGRSYRSGGSIDVLDAARMMNDKKLPQSLRDSSKKYVRNYLKYNEGKDKRLDEELKKELHKGSFGSALGLFIIGFILYLVFFS